MLPRNGKDLVGGGNGLHPDNPAMFLVAVDDGHASLSEDAEAFADALGVVIVSDASLTTLKQALLHDVFGAVKEEDELGGADGILKLVGLFELAWETINEEAALSGAFGVKDIGHGVFEQSDCHLHGHKEAVLRVVANQVAELGAGAVLLSAYEVTRGQMGEAMLLDELGALRALASAGAAKNEDDSDILVRGDGAAVFDELTARRRAIRLGILVYGR